MADKTFFTEQAEEKKSVAEYGSYRATVRLRLIKEALTTISALKRSRLSFASR